MAGIFCVRSALAVTGFLTKYHSNRHTGPSKRICYNRKTISLATLNFFLIVHILAILFVPFVLIHYLWPDICCLLKKKSMKSFRLVALSALLTVASFCAIVYSSCTKDACKGVTCLNGGTCSGGTCTCPTGFIGTNCQTLAFIGTWKGNDVCSVGGPYNNINISIAPSSTDTTRVLITNPGGFGASATVTGTVSSDGKTITYTSQSVSSAVTISGTMTLSSNTAFAHSYSAVDSGASTTCSGNYTKQ